MRILIATDSYWPNLDGGALFQRRLARGLRDLGHSVTVWAPSVHGPQTLESFDGVTIVRSRSRVLLSNRRYRIARLPASFAEAFQAAAPDIVHVHNPGPLGR